VILDDWPETPGHRVVEYGWWDSDNLMSRCTCGWIGLRRTQAGVETVWAEHVVDQRRLAERLRS
jgi:hypothetical protein